MWFEGGKPNSIFIKIYEILFLILNASFADVDDGTGTGLQNSEINLSFEEADLSANLGDLTKLDDDSMIRLLDFENQEDPTLSTTRTPTTTASD